MYKTTFVLASGWKSGVTNGKKNWKVSVTFENDCYWREKVLGVRVQNYQGSKQTMNEDKNWGLLFHDQLIEIRATKEIRKVECRHKELLMDFFFLFSLSLVPSSSSSHGSHQNSMNPTLPQVFFQGYITFGHCTFKRPYWLVYFRSF